MLKIRLSMGGAKKRPVYKIVVADSRFPRDGRFIEKLGFFNPLVPKNKKDRMKIEVERVKHWMSQGAKLTTRVARILGEAEVIPMPTPGNNPLKAIPKKDRKKIEKDSKDNKEDTKKEVVPKVEEKKDQKLAKKTETAPKTEKKKDKK
jgi:small subunit ribosomal protein S16